MHTLWGAWLKTYTRPESASRWRAPNQAWCPFSLGYENSSSGKAVMEPDPPALRHSRRGDRRRSSTRPHACNTGAPPTCFRFAWLGKANTPGKKGLMDVPTKTRRMNWTEPSPTSVPRTSSILCPGLGSSMEQNGKALSSQILSPKGTPHLSWEANRWCHDSVSHSRNGTSVSSWVKLHGSCSQEREEGSGGEGKVCFLFHQEHMFRD